ncbi:MAG: 50S ribosomal protein L29 [Actinobacteria bacterium]|nr:50S ribosomal protein L29 [Actinomycetota bacterium]
MPAPIKELRDMSDGELVTRLRTSKEELFNLRFQNATGQLDNHARIGQVRKDIARCETLLREREIEAAETEEGDG